MLVYGDAVNEVLSADLQSSILKSIEDCLRLPAGLRRHETLVRAFIQTGEFVQGLADREFEQKGNDDLSPIQETGAHLLKVIAIAIDGSWRNGFGGELTLHPDWLKLLNQLSMVGTIKTKQAEGHAFYALYPESFLAAARTSGLGPDTIVIGLRSIGTGLAALVAATIGAAPALTLRPVGNPFDRRIAVSPALRTKILERDDARYAIVDEGPGLSGSSFGSIADWLESHGIAENRIHVFPSHKGDLGVQASERHRKRWMRIQRHCVVVDDVILDFAAPTHTLQHWTSELIGSEIDSWKDISGGAWRDLDRANSAYRPPADMQNEKRKFLASCGDQHWLVKFAGLGEDGARKLRKATVLSEAGFTPKIAGARYGFLVEQWQSGMKLPQAAIEKSRVIEAIGGYLGFRAKHLRSGVRGASLHDLCRMAIVNSDELLGAEAARGIRRAIANADRLAPALSPVDTDNRLHAWEWLVSPCGSCIVKTDAVDHSGAHDLIGCQDIAWDIAGAGVEFDLTDSERRRLRGIIAAAAGYESSEETIALYEILYLCFQAGLWTFAAASQTGEEAKSAARLVQCYAGRLSSIIKD